MITIYHNPRCSKSRAAYALLVDELAGREEVRTVEYLKTPPTLDDLKQLHALLGVSVREMIRENEPAFTELGLDDARYLRTRFSRRFPTIPHCCNARSLFAIPGL